MCVEQPITDLLWSDKERDLIYRSSKNLSVVWERVWRGTILPRSKLKRTRDHQPHDQSRFTAEGDRVAVHVVRIEETMHKIGVSDRLC